MSSGNPFSKIPAPVNPDPRTISLVDFQKYQSNEMAKYHANVRSFKKSLPMLGGCLLASAIGCYFGEKFVKEHLFGVDCKICGYLR